MKKERGLFRLLCVLCAVCFAACGVCLVRVWAVDAQRTGAPVPPVVSSLQIAAQSSSVPQTVFTQKTLFVSPARENYCGGEMLLVVPKLALSAPVLDGTAEETLNAGVCLYENAQLPGEGKNSNVSIAAHRAAYGCEFLHIDTLCEGDLFYLYYNGLCYEYAYRETAVVEPTDWSRIYCTGESLLTLTSCHPLYLSTQRICVQAVLQKVTPTAWQPAAQGAEAPQSVAAAHQSGKSAA